MGWQIGFVGGRDVGYGVPCQCEYPTCKKKIDRGLSYACGGFPGDTEFGCNGFFCEKHMFGYEDEYGEWHQACDVCVYNHSLPEYAPYTEYKEHYPEKPDLPVWIRWKLKDKSWAEWRQNHPEEVEKMKSMLAKEKT
jgi:hypothetical protein